jgi:hypothetical protein
VVSNINWFFPEPAAKLRDRCNGDMIQRPQGVFVESLGTLCQPNLDECRQKIILAGEIFLLEPRIKFFVLFFQNEH